LKNKVKNPEGGRGGKLGKRKKAMGAKRDGGPAKPKAVNG